MSIARRALRSLPFAATTGIGSLPHTDPGRALQLALEHDVPFLPQLAAQNPSELMLPAALDGLPGLSFDPEGGCTIDLDGWRRKRDPFALEIEQALQTRALAGFEPSGGVFRPFLEELAQRKPRFAKVQLAGPATVRWHARTSTGEPASEAAELDQQIFRLLIAKSLALVKAVQRSGSTPILFLDESGLIALDRRNPRHGVVLQELKVLIATVQGAGALVGLHCCGNTDWAALLELGLDVLSIDARLSLDAVLEERAAVLEFLSEGSTFALGVVPTERGATYALTELVDSIDASLRATIPRGTSVEAVIARSMLTPACGLATRTEADAERIIGEVREAQQRLKALTEGRGVPS